MKRKKKSAKNAKKLRRKNRYRRNPWTARDVARHNKKCAANAACRKKWASIANSVLKKTGDEARAIRIANWQVKQLGLLKGKKRGRRNPWSELEDPLEKKIRKLCRNTDLSPEEISEYMNVPLGWVTQACAVRRRNPQKLSAAAKRRKRRANKAKIKAARASVKARKKKILKAKAAAKTRKQKKALLNVFLKLTPEEKLAVLDRAAHLQQTKHGVKLVYKRRCKRR